MSVQRSITNVNNAFPSREAGGDRAVEIAFGYIGLPYVFAGGDLDGPTNGGFDRAGFSRRVVYAASGIDIGRTLAEQINYCEELDGSGTVGTNIRGPDAPCGGSLRSCQCSAARRRWSILSSRSMYNMKVAAG
jgi:hypothetical protein